MIAVPGAPESKSYADHTGEDTKFLRIHRNYTHGKIRGGCLFLLLIREIALLFLCTFLISMDHLDILQTEPTLVSGT
ncbi:hypothetical protein BDZ94DRAFT_1270332 [Collybia nuda]|uniref:Uncharacterized protein n=1 Tax=Collybia nuda TaxID=64659 RepID=A0A9P5XWW8_9AGAR|nr:hypothetical protein BDZ94DRAFT_1270332 [Collybia nuda]